MKYYSVATVLSLLVFVTGCSADSTDEQASSEITTATTHSITEAFQRNLQAGETITYAPDVVVTNLPKIVSPQQVGDVMSFGDMLFVIILRPSPVVTVDMPEADIKFAGVLTSLDNGASWDTFYHISLKRERTIGQYNKETIYWNVIGMFIRDGKMYIDMADELNNVLRGTVVDSGRGAGFRETDDCYTFSAATYYEPSPTDRQRINPESLPKASNCEWGSLPDKAYAL